MSISLEKQLSEEEKEIYKVIKILRQDDYSIEDYLKVINKIKRQEPRKTKITLPNH